MQSVISTMRRNQKILIVIIFVILALYFMMTPSKKSRQQRFIHDNKVRHPVSYFLDQSTKNDTLFNLVTHQNFQHPGTAPALHQYLRPKQYSQSPSVNNHGAVEPFNAETDVFIYLHIQKVGGTTFNYHLINDLITEKPCVCEKDVLTNPCYCKTEQGNIWLFSWFTVGWPCGLHADWTMLHECVDKAVDAIEGKQRKRRYFYITLLRDPVARYLSEWQHQKAGQHWEDAKLRCGGQRVSLFEVRPCFQDSWEGVTLDEFMHCPDNLATNRQTRMLADLTRSQCYKKTNLNEKDNQRLDSAKENLEQMAFFGITKLQLETQKLFEETFKMKFIKNFKVLDEPEDIELSEDEFVNMMKYIELDIQLFLHAQSLFLQRYKEKTVS